MLDKVGLNNYNQIPQALNRLLSAAASNDTFRQVLLKNPLAAITNGYQGQSFDLTHEEIDLLLSVKANSLPELAQQILDLLANHELSNKKDSTNGSISSKNGHSKNGIDQTNGNKPKESF